MFPSLFHSVSKWLKKPYIVSISLLIIALLSRFLVLGNPFIFCDEEFYLFVGGRMLHGDLPYVDIWDRKPIGIFLLYEFFHLFGPYRIWAYQIAALLSAWGTACITTRLARFIAPAAGAFIAGCLYLFWSAALGGSGGQTPIFYNLLISWAFLLIVRHIAGTSSITLWRTGIYVMALFGITLQLKTSVVFEGIYAGLALLWLSKQAQTSWSQLCLRTFCWCTIALLPTLLVIGLYTVNGYFHDWWFANVSSILLKTSPSVKTSLEFWHRLHWLFVTGSMIISMTVLRFFTKSHETSITLRRFLMGWVWCAFAAYLIFGNFAKHYALPLLVPIFVSAAPLWQEKFKRLWFALFLLWGMQRTYAEEKKIIHSGTTKTLQEAQKILSTPNGCIFNYGGPDILLDIVPYCSLTRYPFSSHLQMLSEKNAIGTNTQDETANILQKKPLYIIIDDNEKFGKYFNYENTETKDMVMSTITRDYHKVYTHQESKGKDDIIIFKRNQ